MGRTYGVQVSEEGYDEKGDCVEEADHYEPDNTKELLSGELAI